MARPIGPRRLGLLLLAAGVVLAHLAVGERVAGGLAEVGAGLATASPRRLTALFTRDLRPQAPAAEAAAVRLPAPAPGARVARQARPPAPQPAASAASAPMADAPAAVAADAQPAPVEPDAPPMPLPPAAPAPAGALAAAETAASAPLAQSASASAPAPASSAAGTAVTVDWPLSTRLSYRLTGDYRGPVEGQASVEWLREGPRYQVHLDVSVGPSFAPLVSRRMSSDGEIGPDGLTPRRYDEVTHVALRSPRQQTVEFDGAQLRLANGSQLAQPPGVQDTASQFVQLTWLFTTQPQRLRPGESVALPLALPRRLDVWVYDVLAHEPLHTPVGVIDTVHVRPRRPARPDGELAAEVWIAPSLQYLPVRIVIRQDAQTYVDLLLQRLPQQAAPPAQR